MINLLILPLLFIALITNAQTADKDLKEIFKNIKAGMTIKDCKMNRPKSVEKSELSSFSLKEKIGKNGIKEITYEFVEAANEARLHEIIVEFDTKQNGSATCNKLFGKSNCKSPDKMWDAFWLVYNGNNDYKTIAWQFKNKLVLSFDMPNADMHYLFMLKNINTALDMRLNKTGNKLPIVFGQGDFITEILNNLQDGLDFKNPVDSFIKNMSYKLSIDEENKIKLTEGISPIVAESFRNGLNTISIFYDKNNNNIYDKIVFEMDNADTLKAMCSVMDKHPKVPNCYVMGIQGENENAKLIYALCWLNGNRLTLGVNLPNSEMAKNKDFNLSNEEVRKAIGK
jgi:hypothetical protein